MTHKLLLSWACFGTLFLWFGGNCLVDARIDSTFYDGELERMDIFFIARSYDGTMWHCRDGVDRQIPDDAPDYKDTAAIMAYIDEMDCPEEEKPAIRTLKDGTQEPDVLNDGNCWVSVKSPTTKERHSFLIASDGFHYVPANTYVPAVEAVTGKNYVRKLEYTTAPTNFHRLRRIALSIAMGKRVDTVIDEDTGYLYKGSDFAVDFLLRIVDDEQRAILRSSSGTWPLSLRMLDNYYFEHYGQSAFERHGISRAGLPPRAHLSTLSQHSLDVSPFTGAEQMDIYLVVRSYDGTMWYCRDGVDRPIPDDAPDYKDTEAIMAYIDAMDCPEGEKPAIRTLKDGTQEPDVDDDGNCWVSVRSPTTGERHSFMIDTDGYHDVRANTHVPGIEDISGKTYVKKLSFQTVPLTFAEIKAIGAEVNGGRRVQTVVDDGESAYKGTDFAIDFILSIVDDAVRDRLRESANHWPVSLQLFDAHYHEKFGVSAFKRHGIPRGQVPARAHLSAMSVDSLDVSPLTPHYD